MQQIGKNTIYQSPFTSSAYIQRPSDISQPFINLRLLHHSTHPLGSSHPRPGPLLQLPGPHTPRLSTRYPRPARLLQDSYQTRSSLNGPTMPSIRRSLDQFGHGPSACSTRISSAHKHSAGSGRIQSSQTGCSGTPIPEKANGYKVLVGP